MTHVNNLDQDFGVALFLFDVVDLKHHILVGLFVSFTVFHFKYNVLEMSRVHPDKLTQ